MKENEVTAEWARKTSNSVLGDKIKKEISECEELIITAVHKNEMSCNVFMTLHTLTKKELVSRGFKVNHHEGENQRETSYTTIEW